MNIYDIADRAGVSPATVSRVLNNHGNVKAETREKVQKVIQGMNYKPNALARNLSVGDTQNIAFLVPDIENPFFSRILHGISDKALEYDYNVFMFGTDENPELEHRVLDSIKPELVKGLIIIPVSEADLKTAEKLRELEEQGIPAVLVDRDVLGGKLNGVFSDDVEGALAAVRCLIEEGHRKIAIIAGPETSRPGYDRLKGYRRALQEAGIEQREEYVVFGNFREEESCGAMHRLMELPDPPTAVFTSSNMTTLGCLHCLKELGLELGRDISLAGFDDIRELEYTNIRLTAVVRPVYEMGCEAMRILEQRFQNRCDSIPEGYIVQRSMVKTWLVKRGSEKYADFQKGKRNE